VVAELLEDRLVVWDIAAARWLYSLGFYGKPLGLTKPKSLDFDAPLVLDLIEGYYLAEKGLLVVQDPIAQARLELDGLRKYCEAHHSGFREKYLVYRELREAGYVVTPGIKFGADFAVYEQGPGIDHAPFLVEVYGPEDSLTATEVVLSGRLATTVRKRFIIALTYPEEGRVEFLLFAWWRA
jgi:tRNA-intron endonuclease